MFRDILCKLGNMVVERRWSIYPCKPTDCKVIIQCSHRIAEVNLETGKAMLSDGKGGHQGFMKLSGMLGAKLVDAPAGVIEQLREFRSQSSGGAVSLSEL